MPTDPVRDPVPPAARAVIDLFRRSLPDVTFPDVDRAALDAAERELLDAQRALEDAEAALDRARTLVTERSATLTSRAQRALAYARVYSEGDDDLALAVDRAAGTKKPEEPAPVRRPRKKKSEPEGTTLFEADAPPLDLAS